MALRLRRGTDAERQLITPAEGELIYTTDTKSVYIGDGTTVGGIIISGEIGLGDLAEVDLSTPPTVGQTLVWDGSKFVPDNIEGTTNSSIFDLNDVFSFTPPDSGDILIYDGVNFVPERIRFIYGDDSSTMLDTATNTFTGNFIGDGSQLTNLPGSSVSSIFDLNDVFSFTPPDPGDILIYDGVNFTPDRIRIITGDDSSIMLDTATNTFTGNFIGDGSGLTNLPGSSVSSIFDLNDVFAFTPPDTGNILIYDGLNFTPDRIRIITGDDSSIMLDTATNTFIGNFIGDGSGLTNISAFELNGDYRIDIIGDDSSLLVDSTNGIHYGIFNGNLINDAQQVIFDSSSSIITIQEFKSTINNFTFNRADTNSTDQVKIDVRAKDNIAILQLSRISDNDISSDDIPYGAIYFERGDPISGFYSPCAITGRIDGLAFIADNTGEFPEIKTLKLTDFGDLGLGTYTPTAKLDVRGNAVFEGDVQAAAFKGSVVADDSTTIIDGLNGTITAQGFIQFGSYTDAEIALITPVNGMVYYNSTNNKFRGYQGGTWINLDGTTI